MQIEFREHYEFKFGSVSAEGARYLQRKECKFVAFLHQHTLYVVLYEGYVALHANEARRWISAFPETEFYAAGTRPVGQSFLIGSKTCDGHYGRSCPADWTEEQKLQFCKELERSLTELSESK